MQNAAAVRERLFTMRMSNEEWERAERLAAHEGVNVASLLRQLLKHKERELGLLAPSSPPPATKKSTKPSRKR